MKSHFVSDNQVWARADILKVDPMPGDVCLEAHSDSCSDCQIRATHAEAELCRKHVAVTDLGCL